MPERIDTITPTNEATKIDDQQVVEIAALKAENARLNNLLDQIRAEVQAWENDEGLESAGNMKAIRRMLNSAADAAKGAT